MPQMNKGGKFIFGKSLIMENGVMKFPGQAIREYNITAEGKIYLFTGSKSTGGFCVTRKGLLEPSKIGHILGDNPKLKEYSSRSGEFIKFKGRAYAWIDISWDGKIILSWRISLSKRKHKTTADGHCFVRIHYAEDRVPLGGCYGR